MEYLDQPDLNPHNFPNQSISSFTLDSLSKLPGADPPQLPATSSPDMDLESGNSGLSHSDIEKSGHFDSGKYFSNFEQPSLDLFSGTDFSVSSNNQEHLQNLLLQNQQLKARNSELESKFSLLLQQIERGPKFGGKMGSDEDLSGTFVFLQENEALKKENAAIRNENAQVRELLNQLTKEKSLIDSKMKILQTQVNDLQQDQLVPESPSMPTDEISTHRLSKKKATPIAQLYARRKEQELQIKALNEAIELSKNEKKIMAEQIISLEQTNKDVNLRVTANQLLVNYLRKQLEQEKSSSPTYDAHFTELIRILNVHFDEADQVSLLKKSYLDLQMYISEQQSYTCSLKLTIDQLKRGISSLDQEKQIILKKLESSILEKEAMVKSHMETYREKTELLVHLRQVQEDFASFNEEKKTLTENLSQAQEEMQAMQGSYERLISENVSLQRTLDVLSNKKGSSFVSRMESAADFDVQMTLMRKDLESAVQKYEKLQKEHESTLENLLTLEKDVVERDKSLFTMKSELENTTEHYELLKISYRQLAKDMNDLQDKYQHTKESMQSFDKEREVLLGQLRKQNEWLERMEAILESSISSGSQSNSDTLTGSPLNTTRKIDMSGGSTMALFAEWIQEKAGKSDNPMDKDRQDKYFQRQNISDVVEQPNREQDPLMKSPLYNRSHSYSATSSLRQFLMESNAQLSKEIEAIKQYKMTRMSQQNGEDQPPHLLVSPNDVTY